MAKGRLLETVAPFACLRPFADLRRARGLDLRWASISLGISRGYLQRLERGAVPLPWHLAHRMSRIYGCDISQLVTRA